MKVTGNRTKTLVNNKKRKNQIILHPNRRLTQKIMPLGPDDIRTNIEAPPIFNPKPSLDLGSKSQTPKDSQTLKIQEMMPPLKSGEGPHSMVDTLIVIPISTIELGSRDLDDVIPLNEYKFDKSLMAMVKWTPKCRKIVMGGLEKPVTDGFKESTIWNIVG